MESNELTALLNSLMGLALCFHFRLAIREWKTQSILMKTVLFVIGANTVGAIAITLMLLIY